MKYQKPCIAGGTPTRKKFLSFSPPSIGQEEINEVIATLKGGWITTGPRVQKFEQNIANYIDCKYTVALSSCTAGLFLSMIALDLKKGDEVITTPYTFAATANVILHCGAIPVFADIEPNTLNIDPEKIENKITDKTKGIIPVHFGGRPCDMDRINEIAQKYNLWIIDDAAHAIGTKYKDKFIGTTSDITSFSFHAVKNLTTAEGGMISTNNKEWADFIKIMSIHGMSKDAWQKGKSWYYEILYPGYKCNMTDIQAAIGIHQLDKLERFIIQRENCAGIYDNSFSSLDEIEILSPCTIGRNTFHLYVIKLKLENLTINRDKFIQAMIAENIQVNVHYIPVHLHPYYQNYLHHKQGELPIAEDTYQRVISLPIYPAMSEKDICDVVNAVKKISYHYRK